MPAVQNVSALDATLLERVEPRIVAQLPERMLLLKFVERVSAKTMGGGRSYVIVIKTQHGESFRAMRESEPVPDSSVGKHERLAVPTRLMASTFDVAALAEAVSKGNDNGLIDAVSEGTKDLTLAYRRNWSRSLYLMADGAVAKVESLDAAANTITFSAASVTNRWATAFLRPGMRISSSANVDAGDYKAEDPLDCEITDVNPATRTITVDNLTAGDTAAAHFIFIGGPKFTSKNREWNGLLGAIDDGTLMDPYLTKSRTGAGGTLWQSTVVSSVGTQNLERLLIANATTIMNRSDEMFTHIISTPGVFNAYAMPFMAARTWPQSGSGAIKVVGGYAKMDILLNGSVVEWFQDPDGLKGELFGFPKTFAEIVEVKAPGFWVGEGNKPVRSTTNLISRFIFWGAGDFIVKRPNAGLRFDGITEIPA